MYDVECQHKTGEDKNSLIIQGSNVKVDAERLNGHAARCFKNCKKSCFKFYLFESFKWLQI